MKLIIGLIFLMMLFIFIKKDFYENFCPSPTQPKMFALRMRPNHVVKTTPRVNQNMYCYLTDCPECLKKKENKYSCWKCHIKW